MSKSWQTGFAASVLIHAAVFAAVPLATHWLAREQSDADRGSEAVIFQLLDDRLAQGEAFISEPVASTVPAQSPVLTASAPTREPDPAHPLGPVALPPPEREPVQLISFEPAAPVQKPDKPVSVNATEGRDAPAVTQVALAAKLFDSQPDGVPAANLGQSEAKGGTRTLPPTGSGEAFKAAKPRHAMNTSAVYPSAARRRNQQGVVLVTASVTALGTVAEAQVRESSGWKLLDEAALKLVYQVPFDPARRGSTAVISTVEIPVKFQLTR